MSNCARVRLVACLFLIWGVVGCAAEEANDSPPDERESGHLIARVDLNNGVTVDFHDVGDEIVISSVMPTAESASIRAATAQSSTPVELYEALASVEAPRSLSDVQDRLRGESAAVAVDDDPNSSPIEALADAPAGKHIEAGNGLESATYAMTGDAFEDWGCDPSPGWDEHRCKTYRTNDTAWERRGTRMDTWLNCYRGQLTHFNKKKTLLSWDSSYNFVFENETSYIGRWGSRARRRMEATGASGDGYHYSWYIWD